MGGFSSSQHGEAVALSGNQCLLFRTRPAFHLALSRDRVGDAVECFSKYQSDGRRAAV
jgi:hypothetical protein